jgi:hypothetical protein
MVRDVVAKLPFIRRRDHVADKADFGLRLR